MRLSQGGITLWYGTPDAPAPSGAVASGSDASITVGMEPADTTAQIVILYRINHGDPRTVQAQSVRHDPPGKYFVAHLTGFKEGDKVEYVAVCHCKGHQVPSTQDAEHSVVTFNVTPLPTSHTEHGSRESHSAVQAAPPADFKEALREVLRACSIQRGIEETFINLYFGHLGHAEAFWEDARKHSELKPHIDQLQFALQLDLLTSANAPLMSLLVKLPGVKSTRDLAILDESVWHGLIERSGIPEHVRPTEPHVSSHATLARIHSKQSHTSAGTVQVAQEHGAASHTITTDSNAAHAHGHTPQTHSSGNRGAVELYQASIIATLQAAFPTLTVLRIVKASQHVDKHAAIFLENAPDFDITTTIVDTYLDHHASATFKGIPVDQRPAVTTEIKRLQRLFAVSTNAATFRDLLGLKLESAHKIATIPRATFVSHFGSHLGGAAAATALHERAQFINARNLHLRTTIHDAIHTPPTRGLGHHSHAHKASLFKGLPSKVRAVDHKLLHGAHEGEESSSLTEDLSSRFPNSDELFGSFSLCDCQECESAIGPAAYMVDVLDFLGSSKPNNHGVTPLDVLIGSAEKKIVGRRPDLAHIPLTCANTTTAMPYVDIINEILESYVALGLKLNGSSAHDSAKSTSAELDANPQNVDNKAYEILDRAVYPFTLPFNRPLALSRTYLGQLGATRHDILYAFHKDRSSQTMKHALAAEQLGISAEEFLILTGHHFDEHEKPHTKPTADFYGYQGVGDHAGNEHAAGHWIDELSDASTFLQRTGLCYADLEALLSTRYVNPDQPSGYARDLLNRIPVSYAELHELLTSGLSHPLSAMADIETNGITAHELDTWRKDNLDHVAKMIVIDGPQGSCDVARMKLTRFDGTSLDENDYDRMHRFIRLYRKTGWTIVDLDRAFNAIGLQEITADLLSHVAEIKRLQSKLHIKNLQILLAFWAPIQFRGQDSLYRGLFLSRATYRQGLDVAFEQEFPDSAVLTNTQEMVQKNASVLQGAFQISALELDLILLDCGLDPATAPLNLDNVSAIYRRAALSRALKLKVRDFLSLKALAEHDPFSGTSETAQFVSAAATIGHSGLTPLQLDYIVRHISPVHGGLEPREAIVFEIARKLREGYAAIAADNIYTPDPSGAITSQKLGLIFDAGVVDQLTKIVNGTVNFTTPLITLPAAAAIPPELAKKIIYDPIGQALIVKSPLTSADRTILFALATDTAYQSAVNNLYQQPLDAIECALSPFMDTTQAKKTLVTEAASVDQDLSPVLLDVGGLVTTDPKQAHGTLIANKWAYILQALLPYLIRQLGRAFAKRTIADALKLTDSMAQRLLESALVSRSDSARPALHDIHQLSAQGLSAAYYSSADLSGTPTITIDPTVWFDGVKRPLAKGSSSASWRGMILAPSAGDYVFIIRTNGVPSLWIGDPTTPRMLAQTAETGEWIAEKVALKPEQLAYLRLDIVKLPEQNSSASLLWESAAIRKSAVPAANTYPASVLQSFKESYILFQKASIIVNALKLTDDEVSFLSHEAHDLPAMDLNRLPVSRDSLTSDLIDQHAPALFGGLLRASRFAAFRQELPSGDVTLTQLFASNSLHEGVDALVSLTGWDVQATLDMVGKQGFNLEADELKNEGWPLRLRECINLVNKLGVSPRLLFKWSTLSSNFKMLEEIAREIKKSLQAQYDPDTWLTVAKPLNDALRDAQRNALVAYLLPRMRLRDTDQLFEHFLIDPEMGVCTETSRISLAHSSIQTFVQRCLLNLEENDGHQSVSPHQIDSDQWEKWRKHYRFWQANYRVLLTPEYWLDQSLRDDKTPFFEALEAELMQQEITADNVETAYLNYLEKLAEVARLEVIGTFWQDKDPDTNEEVNTLHIIARTFHSPHTYFYRTFVNYTTWMAWEEMGAAIDGDHVMPLIWNRRLYVFWPVFVKKSVQPGHPKSVSASASIPMDDPKSYWQMSLAWSELRHNKWTAKQLSKNAVDIDPDYYVEDDPSRYAKFAYSFKTSIINDSSGVPDSLVLRCIYHGPTVSINALGWLGIKITIKGTTEVVGAFEVGGCNGESVDAIYGTMPYPNPVTPPGTNVEALTFVQTPGKIGLNLTKAGSSQPVEFLHASPTMYRLLCPHQFADYMLQAPLFYQDRRRTYFMTPHDDRGTVGRVASSTHAVFDRPHIVRKARAATRSLQDGEGAAKSVSQKSEHAGQSEKQSHGSGIVLHSGAGELSNVLQALEESLEDIGESFARNATNRNSAWSNHAAGHNVHPSTATHAKFETFYHPFVCDFMKSLTRLGVDGLLTESNQSLRAREFDDFKHLYQPTQHISQPLPADSVDFEDGPYAIYNQELFHHIPELISDRLSQNRRFADATRWLKYIFDPTDDCEKELPPDRYWKYLPFKRTPRDGIQQLLGKMESGDEKHSQLISDWAKNPFQPFAIARHRPEAFKKSIFIKYVRTLVDQGDTLFRSDLKEAVNEAQQYYVMAAHLLGPRPEGIRTKSIKKAETYASLRSKVDVLSDLFILLENEFPFKGKVTSHPRSDSGGLQNMGRSLYFCAPGNDKLFELWDIVADRLFKIRNCMNIEGVVRQLPLFDPPIDPGMLVRAAALGIDLGSLLSDIGAPLPNYRFTYMIQKALEMCNECRTFGGALLSALEKNDAEALAVMRSQHEVGILDLMHQVKLRQLDEANAQIDALNASRNMAGQRYMYYKGLNGDTGATIPEPGVNIPLPPVPSKKPKDGGDGIQLLPEEQTEMDLLTAAAVVQDVATGAQAVAAVLHGIPQIGADGKPLGVGVTLTEGGIQLGNVADTVATVIRLGGEILSQLAAHSGKMAGYFRRQAEWALQANVAACEIMQIDKQIAAANIRSDIAQKELTSHEKQMDNAKTVLDFLTDKKFTNQDLYSWMVSDTSASYFTCYQMAYDIAKKAERTFQYERGLTDSSYIQYGYWDSLRKGLLAGDRLHLALKRMEVAYADHNAREYEISKDVSLLLNAPLALISLKESGVCEFVLPEPLFDSDYPGQYMRRVRNITVSIPCVVGAYTNINCKLTMLTNTTRVKTTVGDQYSQDMQTDDDRFVNNFAAVQSIATSHGSNDGGLFEINFRDERYLPFEGAGVLSRWRLEMPIENNAFDFQTVSDVILHLKYTAREGGDPLKQAARASIAAQQQDDMLRLFSLKHEFSAAWNGFINSTAASQTMNLPLNSERFPYLFRGKTISVTAVELFLKFKDVRDAKAYTRDGTPMGDYSLGSPLAVYVTPPDGTEVKAPLKSTQTLYGGTPHALVDLSDQSAEAGIWTIEARGPDIAAITASLRKKSDANAPDRLKGELITDLILVCHYSVS